MKGNEWLAQGWGWGTRFLLGINATTAGLIISAIYTLANQHDYCCFCKRPQSLVVDITFSVGEDFKSARRVSTELTY